MHFISVNNSESRGKTKVSFLIILAETEARCVVYLHLNKKNSQRASKHALQIAFFRMQVYTGRELRVTFCTVNRIVFCNDCERRLRGVNALLYAWLLTNQIVSYI